MLHTLKKIFSKGNNRVGAVGEFTIKAMRNGEVVRTMVIKNQVLNTTDRGVQLLIQQMAGVTTNPIDIDTLSIGTDNSARTTTMTNLVAPVTTNIPFADRAAVGNEWQGDFLVLDSELPDDTYYEVGVFMHGKMYASALISGGFSKVTGEDLLISYKATLTPA